MDMTKVFLHQIAVPGQPGNITDAEAAAMRADQAEILARPTIETLTDIPDVAGTPADGQVCAWDAASATWIPTNVGVPLEVEQEAAATRFGPVRVIDFRGGLAAAESDNYPGVAIVQPIYGSSESTVAEGGHTHSLIPGEAHYVAATGSLSSGTRTLISGTVSGLDPDIAHRLSAHLIGEIRGEGSGAGRSLPSITLGTSTLNRFGGSAGYVRTVAGVDREYSMWHQNYGIAGVTSVAFSAQISHVDGDPKYIGGASLFIRIMASR